MEIKTYWNERAANETARATTNDIYLRVLERETLTQHLRRLGCNANSRILDAGCGDGETLIAIARAFGCDCVGRDYAASMIELAKQKQAAEPPLRVEFAVGDVREAGNNFAADSFDFVMTDRCLINLETPEQQYGAIAGLAKILRPGGVYLAIENFVEGNDRLNALRATFGLKPIEIRWHNLFFHRDVFESEARKNFRDVQEIDFSSAYYLATRVIYSKLCAADGKEPDYLHPIHEASVKLPGFGDFSPIKLYLLTK